MEQDARHEANQYLTFTLEDEVFALEIDKVREVLDFCTVTKVPRAPSYMRGVINLRGNVVPVMDMRRKLSMEGAMVSVNTCIIITEVLVGSETMVLGAMADSVQEVLDLEPDQINPTPNMGTGIENNFIRGIGKRGEQFVMILDIDRVFSGCEFSVAQDEVQIEAA